jgi:hypothetical protein
MPPKTPPPPAGIAVVSFRDCQVGSVDAQGTARARCVRSTPTAAPAQPFARVGSVPGEVQDTLTGLVWEQGHSGQALGWSDAKAYCAASSIGGHRWRLPSMKELQTLVTLFTGWNADVTAAAFPDFVPPVGSQGAIPHIDVTTDAYAGTMWSSSPALGVAIDYDMAQPLGDGVWVFGDYGGLQVASGGVSRASARCVR